MNGKLTETSILNLGFNKDIENNNYIKDNFSIEPTNKKDFFDFKYEGFFIDMVDSIYAVEHLLTQNY